MDEFPAKVSTETSSQPTQSNSGFRGFSVGPVKMDVLFIRTIPGILMIVEIVLGLLVWALIAGSTILKHAFGWVMFVSVTLWVITTFLFVVYLLSVPEKIQFVPWPIAMLIFNVIATVLYITAFITNAASVPANSAPDYNNLAASAVIEHRWFCCAVLCEIDFKNKSSSVPKLTASPLFAPTVLCMSGYDRLLCKLLLQLHCVPRTGQQRSNKPSDRKPPSIAKYSTLHKQQGALTHVYILTNLSMFFEVKPSLVLSAFRLQNVKGGCHLL
ncbi:UNVERIFIED_CONTAM: hypothetical protein FKN15_071385 [Acipenser sinensis]